MAYVSIDGVRIHYRVEGTGPTVVLQHGFSDSLESWYEYGYVEALGPDHTVVLIDARGHGQSDKPHDPGAYDRRREADDAVAVLDDVGVAAAAFVGVSMGGWIGLRLAHWAPDRFERIIVMAAGAAGSPSEGDVLVNILRDGPEGMLRVWESQGEISDALKARLLSIDCEALIARLGALGAPFSTYDVLSGYPGAYLFVAGERDPDYEPIRALCHRLGPDSLVTLPGLNHLQSFQRSDLVLPHLQQFLRAGPA